ncbi:MAG: biotin/lipoyl-binding protein [Archaeoglobales archaeon]|nr:biotin/lipoyl-binding protein [Archaeoglobi archaeon]NHW23098.1 biotin/lipoyl-binding protein [Archaeoglobales archaeon]
MKYRVEIDGKVYFVEVEETGIYEFKVTVNGKTAIFEVRPKVEVKAVKEEIKTEIKEKEERKVERKLEGKVIKAPMNGVVTKILVKVGDDVKEGDTVAVIEAMKMENPIKSPFSGKVLEVLVKVGDKVSKESPLIRLG